MEFKQLSVYLEKLEKTSSRLTITELLAELIKKADSKEVSEITNLLLGRLAPSFRSIVFNLADRMMLQAVGRAYGVELSKAKNLYKQKGDLGIVAEQLNKNSQSDMAVTRVYKRLVDIAELGGGGSQDEKIEQMANLLAELDSKSSRYVARIPVGKLRLGFSDKTFIDALSWYLVGDKSKSSEIEKLYEIYPDIGEIVKRVKSGGLSKTAKKIKIEFGVPVMPMLAQRLKSADEMIAKMGEIAIEPKFDGLRVILHYKKGEQVRAYTRNLNEISFMFPELATLGEFLKADSAILDSEAVGLDPETKKMVNFQMTMKRRRKHGVEAASGNIPLRFQIFDLLYKNGEDLMDNSYLERRKALESTVKDNKVFRVDEKFVTNSPEEIREKHKEYLSKGLEGIIVKKTSAKYVPGRTGYRWVKMKEVELTQGKLADTVEVLIMGYTQGQGKRAQFGLGQFLAGIIDMGIYKSITKVGTGISEEQLVYLAKELRKLRTEKQPSNYEVHKDLWPDFWVEPKIVVELAADEITKSPKHTAGLALRFPRLVKFRPDKNPEQVTTLNEVKKLYEMQ